MSMDARLSDPLCQLFWTAAAAGELQLPWCALCEAAVWYPEPKCPDCQGRLHWQRLSGRATLLSWTVVRKPINTDFEVPYIPALVVPEEAPHARLVTQLIDCEPQALICDMSLFLKFRPLRLRDGRHFVAPLFAPML